MLSFKQVTVMMAYIVFMVLAGYGLYIVANFVGYRNGRGRALRYGQKVPTFAGDFVIFEGIVLVIMSFNSAINPLIYHWKSADFREAFKIILGCSRKEKDNKHSGTDSKNATTSTTANTES